MIIFANKIGKAGREVPLRASVEELVSCAKVLLRFRRKGHTFSRKWVLTLAFHYIVLVPLKHSNRIKAKSV